MTRFKRDEIVLLLGAGASVEAKIPHSKEMITQIERLIVEDRDWRKFKPLYDYVRSAVFYADGVRGIFDDHVAYNIERLVNALEEISRKESHPLYPFVGAWNPKLLEVAGSEFEVANAFRRKILDRLRFKWTVLGESERANYFRGLLDFQREYEHPLRVFTLNYDLCVEKACGLDKVQRGFADRRWDWRVFEDDVGETKPIYLYKLHGSTDWRRHVDGSLSYVDDPSAIHEDETALIFGTSYKLQYIDPFLFFAYELRRWTLAEVRLIVVIGYGFGDDHINGILGQALMQQRAPTLLYVSPFDDGDKERRTQIAKVLNVENQSQVVVRSHKAADFLGEYFTIDRMAEVLPPEEQVFEEISVK